MKIFETKTELQQAKLTEDQLVQIKGSSTPNDGQTNFYYIRTPAQYSGTPDEENDFTLANGNIAELMTGQTRFQNDQLQIWNGTSYEGVRKQRNYITDGIFRFWFQGTNQTSSGYGSDTMWQNGNSGSTKTHTQETLTIGVDLPAVDNPTAEFFSRTVVTSVVGAGNFVNKEHRIESVRSLAGKKCNLSFYAEADSVKNIAFDLTQNFGTGGSPSATVEGINATKQEITADWARYDFVADIPSIAGKTIGTNGDDYLSVTFWYDAGSNFDSRTDSLGQQSGTFDIDCVQLKEGESATKFEEEDFEESQGNVERYYWNSYNDQVPPGTNTSLGEHVYRTDSTANSQYMTWEFPTTMRDQPSVTIYPRDGTPGFLRGSGDVNYPATTAAVNNQRVSVEFSVPSSTRMSGYVECDARL